MSNDPDAIRADIERTRAQMSDNVNALADSANPKHIAQRKVDSVKEKIFGAPEDPYDDGVAGDAQRRAQGAVDTLQGKADDARAAVQDAPRRVKSQARGNPLAAGLIAFGIGALIGGLIPVTEAEKRAADRVKDEAQPLLDKAKEVAQDAGENLKGTAQQAVDEVKQTAQGAAENVKADAQSAKDDVQAQAEDSKQNLSS